VALARYCLAAGLVRLADEMVPVAVVLLALARTGRPSLAGILVAAYTLPAVASGPLLGAWLDRTRHARAALAVNAAVLGTASAGLALAVGRTPAVLSIALAAIAGVTLPLTSAGFTSLLPRLVRAEELARANAVDAMTFNVAAIAGPAVAGGIAAAAGAGAAVAAIAGVAVAGLAAVVVMPREALRGRGERRGGRGQAPPLHPEGSEVASLLPPQTLLAATRAGLRRVVHVAPLRGATVASVIGYGCTGALGVALPLLARALGSAEAAAGWLWAALEAGALLGTLLLARRIPPERPERAVLAGTALFGLAMASWPLAPSLPVAALLVALAGVASGPVLPALFAVRQRHAGSDLLAQVSMTGASLKIAAYSLGAAAGGWLVPALDVRAAILGVAIGQLVAAALGALAGERPGGRVVPAAPAR
jgi:MFS family permease